MTTAMLHSNIERHADYVAMGAGANSDITVMGSTISARRNARISADVDRAVQAARAVLKPWNAICAAERGRILMKLADLLRANQDELAALDTLAYYAGWCDKINGQVVPARPDALTYTVRESIGRGILQGAAGNFKRVTLELGGKSANVIFADANVDGAVRAAASGIFFNAGQVCFAGSCILAQRAVYDEVIERLAQRAKTIKLGDPSERDTNWARSFMAALVHKFASSLIKLHVSRALKAP